MKDKIILKQQFAQFIFLKADNLKKKKKRKFKTKTWKKFQSFQWANPLKNIDFRQGHQWNISNF